MKTLAFVILSLLALTAHAQSFARVSVSCLIVKDGEVSPMDEGISTMEDYNTINAEFEPRINTAGGLGSIQTTLAFTKGNIGGFPLNAKTDRVTIVENGPKITVSIAKKAWRGSLFHVAIVKNQGVLWYGHGLNAPLQNAGTLRCKVGRKL